VPLGREGRSGSRDAVSAYTVPMAASDVLRALVACDGDGPQNSGETRLLGIAAVERAILVRAGRRMDS